MESIKIRAVGYTRLSQEDKNKVDTSIENQMVRIKEYCEHKGYELTNIYNEGFQSGADWDRPQFSQMRQDALKKKFDVLIIRTQSRLARDQQLISEICKDFIAYKTSIETCEGFVLTRDQMVTGIMASVDQYLIDQGRKFQHQMMMDKMKQGKPFGRIPFGYKKVTRLINGKTEVVGWKQDKTEAEMIKLIFETYLAYKSIYKTSYILGHSGSNIRQILVNKKYIGIFEFTVTTKGSKNVRIKALAQDYSYQIPSLKIIEPAMFEEVQKIIKANSTHEDKSEYLKDDE